MKLLSVKDSLMCMTHLLPAAPAMLRFAYLNREQVDQYQIKNLKKIVSYAYDYVPFYKRKYKEAQIHPNDIVSIEDFKKLPLTTKDELIEGFPDRTLSCGTVLEKSIVSMSSGSSGKVISVVYDMKTLGKYMLAGLRTYYMGFPWRPWSKQLSIYSSKHPLDHLLGKHVVVFASTMDQPSILVEKLVSHKPDFLSCYFSVLVEMKIYMQKHAISPPASLKAIFVNSEMSVPQERKKSGEFFNCPVFDEYSSEELNRVAAQCAHGEYHIFEDMNYIEILDDDGKSMPDGEVGQVVGTHLWNYTMPFIRYCQNDMAATKYIECDCGRSSKVLEKLSGRKNDYFISSRGDVFSSGFLLDLSYSFILDFPEAIADYCLIQESPSRIGVELLPGPSFTEAVRENIQKRCESLFQNMEISVTTPSRLTKTSSGSKNPIIRMRQ